MKSYLALFCALLLIAGCAQAPAPVPEAPKVTKYLVGSVLPLTGEGAVYGLPVQKVFQQAIKDLNAKWAAENKELELVFEDGKCNPKDGLTASQTLVNTKGVKVMVGFACSGEALGSATFLEENKVATLSPLTSSPELTKAGGDYYFRNYPSDTAQVAEISKVLAKKKYKNVAILSENTDYAQALRKGYLAALKEQNVQIVTDEIVQPNAKDVRTELLKIRDSEPEAIILLPQTVPMAVDFAKQFAEFGVKADLYSNEIVILKDAVMGFPKELNGLIGPQLKFEENDAFKDLRSKTGCDLGAYCVTAYDAVFLMGEVLLQCGDKDSDCVKKELYATNAWKGPLGGPYSFDDNGDVSGNFELLEVQDGATKKIQG